MLELCSAFVCHVMLETLTKVPEELAILFRVQEDGGSSNLTLPILHGLKAQGIWVLIPSFYNLCLKLTASKSKS
jgi:hypothetical protein